MLLQHHSLIVRLMLLSSLGCVMCRRLVVVEMADGGTSAPFFVEPLDDDHQDLSMPGALPLQAPTTHSQKEPQTSMDNRDFENTVHNDDKISPENHETTPYIKVENTEHDGNKTNPGNHETTENVKVVVTDNEINVTRPNPTLALSTSDSKSTPKHTLKPFLNTTTKIPPTTEQQHVTTQEPTPSQPSLHTCHLSCLEALNATQLTPVDSQVLRAGSSLTLTCQVPLVPELILEDMLWLFHLGDTPEGRCSLTTHKYLPSCQGLPSYSETDYTNDTFLKQTLTLSDMGTNHTGEYICQVQVTCCPGHHQHLMSQLREVNVKVWWMDYTLQLVSTGVPAAVLLLALLGVSMYTWIRGSRKDKVVVVMDTETPAVLHLPLIDNQDVDSFSSSSSIADE